MALDDLPPAFTSLAEVAVTAIRRAYETNAERHDPLSGDDAVVFGIAVYRNSWFMLEQEVEALSGWTSARPLGSLLIAGGGLRLHVYRFGSSADTDLDGFRLDDARASATQRLIAESNASQLSLPGIEPPIEPGPAPDHDLSELVIIHAGNPDDGCCGIWIGAPIAAEEIRRSPWVWIESLWIADAGASGAILAEPGRSGALRHDELPEPIIRLESIEASDAEEL